MSKAVRLEWELPDSLYDAVIGNEHNAADQNPDRRQPRETAGGMAWAS